MKHAHDAADLALHDGTNVDLSDLVPGLGSLEDLDDLMLLDLARSGHDAAFDELFRRYRYPAQRLARHLGPASEVEDVVAEAFAQVLGQLRRGRGPQSAFRAYLFTSVRHEIGRRLKQRARVRVTDEMDELDGVTTLHDGRLEGAELALVRSALAQLPERWRLVLWRIEVEGLRPREVADELGLRPNAVSALAYRARNALRQSYLDAHVTRAVATLPLACRPVRAQLGGYVRHALARRERQAVESHLDECRACMAAVLELHEVNRGLADSGPRSVGTTVDSGRTPFVHDEECDCYLGRAAIA